MSDHEGSMSPKPRGGASPLPYQPIQFGHAESALFGLYHPPVGPPRSAGVVVCNPIGDDDIRAHRTLRHLAIALAAAGFPTLRFDFRGTGDSSGSERDPGCAASWPGDVRAAARELRRRSGAEKVVVVGLRLGATLAAIAASRGLEDADVDGLVLWHPFIGGAAFVDESTKRHRMHELLEPHSFAAVPAGWSGGGREALGFLLTPDTVAMLEGVDLLKLTRPPAPRILVIGASGMSSDEKLVAHLLALGTDAQYRHLPGHKFLVQIPHRSEVPTPVLDEIVRWLLARYPEQQMRKLLAGGTEAFRYGEEPVVFGRSHPLVGVLVHPPKERTDPKRPAIVMSNAGAVHRIGPHRFYVPMARRWAALGFWVLRLDLSGIGDSPAAPGCPENLTYPRDGLADLTSAMDFLAEKAGVRTFVVFGHCSGGDLAYQTALRDPRVKGALMLNPRTFCVNDLAMIESYKNARYYQRSALRAASWKKALRGDVDLRRAASLVLPKFTDLVVRRARALLAKQEQGADSEDVAANLRRLAERGVDTFLLASEKDPGVDFIDVRMGAAMRELTAVRGFRRHDFLGMDHTFTSLYAQERLSEVLTEHLSTRHLQ